MTTKAQPATPLPWSKADGHFQHLTEQDVDYFIHAANAYPKLVEELKRRLAVIQLLIGSDELSNPLLRELGEE